MTTSPATRRSSSPQVPPECDETIVGRARDGDQVALASLYLAHRDPLLSYVASNVRCRHIAEDLVGDAFLRAFTNLDRFRAGSFRAWLFTIARNLVIDHHRRSSHRLEVPVGELLGEHESDPGPTPESIVLDDIETDHLSRLLEAGITQLTSAQRTCVQLRFYEGLNLAQVADRMDRSQGAVKLLQNRAVRALGDILGAERS